MQTLLTLLPFVALAITASSSASPIEGKDGSEYPAGLPIQLTPPHGSVLPGPLRSSTSSYGVSWKQTADPQNSQSSGSLGASVKGHFPTMSPSAETSIGCGLDWKAGALHAGFDGGDGTSGVGGGFTWTHNALSSIVGVHFGEQKVNLNLTVTGENEVLFSVNGEELDWGRVLKAKKRGGKEEEGGWRKVPYGKDAGEVQYTKDGHAYAVDKPLVRGPRGEEAEPLYTYDGKGYIVDRATSKGQPPFDP